MMGSVAFDHIVHDDFSSLIRALIASVFMLTVPGFLVIRILRISSRPLDTAIYSVGISLAFTMLIGVSLNSLLPMIGVEHPLREDIVIAAFVCATLLMSATAFFRTRIEREEEEKAELKIPLNIVFYLLLMIVASILGATYVNDYGNSSIALIFLVLVCMVPVLVVLQKIPASLYPVTIAACGVALLFHKALISQYLTGWDINVEYSFSRNVLENSFWQIGTSFNANSLMSTNILAPSLTEVTGISLTWVYKVVYPILYSLVPVGLYRLLSPMLGRNIAFFSTFFLISTFVFVQVMIDLPRQEIAEIFMILLMIQLFGDGMHGTNRALISMVCIGSLVVSHYALTYVFAFLIIGSWGLLRIRRFRNQSTAPISGRFVAIYLVLIYAWYSTVASSSALNNAIGLGSNMWNGIFTDFLTRQSSQIVNLTVTKTLLMHSVTKYLILLSQVLVMIGIWVVLVKKNRYDISKSYRAFALSNVALLLACVIVPYFAASMNFFRLYQISLLGLAPFFVLGFTAAKKEWNPSLGATRGIAIAVFLSVFLLFNSGFVYRITGEPSYISLDAKMDYPRFVTQEMLSAEWLTDNRNEEMHAYVDDYRWLLLSSLGINTSSLTGNLDPFPPNAESYCYLGKENVVDNNIVLTNWTIRASPILESWPISETDVASVLASSDRILDNGASAIFMIHM
jgi:uncharacterized membrane protein